MDFHNCGVGPCGKVIKGWQTYLIGNCQKSHHRIMTASRLDGTSSTVSSLCFSVRYYKQVYTSSMCIYGFMEGFLTSLLILVLFIVIKANIKFVCKHRCVKQEQQKSLFNHINFRITPNDVTIKTCLKIFVLCVS